MMQGADAPASAQKVLYGEMTWVELQGAVARGRVAVLPIGSIEVHGPHLPLDTDARIAFGVCAEAAARAPQTMVVLPPVSFGISPHHIDFPGSITIDDDRFMGYVHDICRGLVYHGFRRVLLVNAHGGNHAALQIVARRITIDFPDVLCAAVSYYLLPHSQRLRKDVQEPDVRGSMAHGGIVETSLYLALHPAAVDMSQATRQPLPAWQHVGFSTEDAAITLMPYWSTLTPNGVLGDATKASPDLGRRLLEAGGQDVAWAVQTLLGMEPGARVDHHVPPRF